MIVASQDRVAFLDTFPKYSNRKFYFSTNDKLLSYYLSTNNFRIKLPFLQAEVTL